MIHTTRWSPDTCGCVLEYDWDDSLPEVERIHTIKRFVKKCDAHKEINNVEELYDQVKKENVGKNKVRNYIVENLARLVEEKTDDEGKKTKEFKKSVNFNFSFIGQGKNRELSIDLTGANLTAEEIKDIKDNSSIDLLVNIK